MIPEDSYLRRLPVALRRDERLRLEAIVQAADAISVARADMQEIMVRCASGDLELPEPVRVRLISLAWVIVDKFDALKQLLPSLIPKASAKTKAERRKAANTMKAELPFLQPMRDLRNAMDHLNGNIAKLASTGLRLPLFGVVSFFHVPVDGVVETESGPVVTHGRAVCVLGGELPPDANIPLPNPAGKPLRPPISCLRLTAFGIDADLDDVIDETRSLLASLAANIEESIQASIVQASLKSGESIEQLASGGVLVSMMSVDITFTLPPTAHVLA